MSALHRGLEKTNRPGLWGYILAGILNRDGSPTPSPPSVITGSSGLIALQVSLPPSLGTSNDGVWGGGGWCENE